MQNINYSLKIASLVFIVTILGCNKKNNSENHIEENNTQSVNALYTYADSLYIIKEYKKAFKSYDLLLETDSLDGFLFYRKGYCAAQLDYFKTAIKCYEKSLHLGYEPYKNHYNLALSYILIQQDDSLAVHHLKNALEHKPSSQEILDLLKIYGIEEDIEDSI